MRLARRDLRDSILPMMAGLLSVFVGVLEAVWKWFGVSGSALPGCPYAYVMPPPRTYTYSTLHIIILINFYFVVVYLCFGRPPWVGTKRYCLWASCVVAMLSLTLACGGLTSLRMVERYVPTMPDIYCVCFVDPL